MSQIKIFGIDKKLIPIREKLSSVIHSCVMDALGMPENKRAHRFMPMEKETSSCLEVERMHTQLSTYL